MGFLQEVANLKRNFFDQAEKPAVLQIGVDISPRGFAYQNLQRVGQVEKDLPLSPDKIVPDGKEQGYICSYQVGMRGITPPGIFTEVTHVPNDAGQPVTIRLEGPMRTLFEIAKKVDASPVRRIVKEWQPQTPDIDSVVRLT